MEDLSKAPVPKQLAVGGVAGWLSGYVTMKAGKMAATAIGGTLLLLQIAHRKGRSLSGDFWGLFSMKGFLLVFKYI